MKRKLLLLAIIALPLTVLGQSEWELPDSQKPKTEQQSKKDKAKTLDPKYGPGAVPLVDGKVEWDYTIKAPNLTIEEIYQRAQEAIEELTKQEFSKPESRLTAVNKAKHITAAYLSEEMVFSKKALAKDFCEFHCTLIATANDGELNLRLCRITYTYDIGRPNQNIYTSSETITDEEALNKTGTKMYPALGKFRTKTIDRKDEIFQFIESRLK